MILEAKFTGKDSHSGYMPGFRYELEAGSTGGFWISRLDKTGYVVYRTAVLFFREWDSIRVLNHM